MEPKFYVYDLMDDAGQTLYVGKGSGRRLQQQMARYRLSGRVVARYRSEVAAYRAEIARIAEMRPRMNVHKGGNGCRAAKVRKPAWQVEMERVGMRVYAARLLLRFAPHMLEPSKLDAIRRVACG